MSRPWGGNALLAHLESAALVVAVLAHAADVHAVGHAHHRFQLFVEAGGRDLVHAADDLAALGAAGGLDNDKVAAADLQVGRVKIVGPAVFFEFDRDDFHGCSLSVWEFAAGGCRAGVTRPQQHWGGEHRQRQAQVAVGPQSVPRRAAGTQQQGGALCLQPGVAGAAQGRAAHKGQLLQQGSGGGLVPLQFWSPAPARGRRRPGRPARQTPARGPAPRARPAGRWRPGPGRCAPRTKRPGPSAWSRVRRGSRRRSAAAHSGPWHRRDGVGGAAAADGGQHAGCAGGGKQEQHPFGRFLDDLEQGVGRALVHVLGAVQEHDAAAGVRPTGPKCWMASRAARIRLDPDLAGRALAPDGDALAVLAPQNRFGVGAAGGVQVVGGQAACGKAGPAAPARPPAGCCGPAGPRPARRPGPLSAPALPARRSSITAFQTARHW